MQRIESNLSEKEEYALRTQRGWNAKKDIGHCFIVGEYGNNRMSTFGVVPAGLRRKYERELQQRPDRPHTRTLYDIHFTYLGIPFVQPPPPPYFTERSYCKVVYYSLLSLLRHLPAKSFLRNQMSKCP